MLSIIKLRKLCLKAQTHLVNNMIPEVFQYLKTQRTGVLAVKMPDGAPHAATVHFAHSDEPFMFYFETKRDSRKAESLLTQTSVVASLVIGTSESEMKTLQLDGTIELVSPTEKTKFDRVYLAKFPEKEEKIQAETPETGAYICLKFTPTWWRFTDWTTLEGKKIWASKA